MDNETLHEVTKFRPKAGHVSQKAHILLVLILVAWGIVGLVLNAINMTVLTRIKSKETINITLTGMAVSDFMISLTVIGVMLTNLPWIQEIVIRNLRWNPIQVFYLGISFPHKVFARVTIMLTTLVTFERCICVTLPLKVKSIFTRGRVKVAVVVIFMFGVSAIGPDVAVNRLDWTFYPGLNISLLSQVMTEDFYKTYTWSTPLEVFFYFILLFLTVVICTIILITNLKKAMSWRRRNCNLGKSQVTNASTRETRIVKMVILLAIIFITCFIPNTVMMTMISFTKNVYTLQNEGSTMMMAFTWVNYFLAVMNGNLNIFVYYRNNPNYKEVFNKLFRRQIVHQ